MSSSPNKFALVGNPNLVRRDLRARITGERRYSADISAQDIGAASLVYMGLVTSPYPSAKIKKVDVSKAQAAGFATLTGAEMPAYNYYTNGRPFVPLAPDTVIFAGQPVAAVVSADPNGVSDAMDLVKVEYEPQPYVFDPEEALAPGAPQLWPSGNSPIGPAPMHTAFGDVNAGFAQSDEIVEQRFDTSIMTHFELEPTDCVAYWTGSKLYTYEKTNYAFGDQGALAAYFGLALDDVVCRNALGGATNAAAGGIFGNSTGGDAIIIAATLSRKVGAPVKWVSTRFENARVSTNRFPIRGYLKFGGKKDGTLTAMQIRLYFNMGAHGGAIPDGPDDFYNAYNFPNLDMDVYITNTNAYGLAAYQRDVGESQCHFMMETTMDMLAEKLGINPDAFRLKNMRTKANAVDPVAQTPYSELGQPDTFNAGVSAFGWSSKWKGWGTPSSVNGTLRRGVGMALESGNKGAAFPPSSGQIQVNPDGSVIVYSGHCDQGAGTHTTIPIMGAQAIGLTSLDNVTDSAADT
jgi:CO/xanthine dehydrogenase Mo-binding subunit